MPSGTYDETKNNEQDVLVPEPDVQPPAAKKEFDMFAGKVYSMASRPY